MDGNIGSDNTDWKLAVNRCELWAKGRIKRVNGNDQLIKEIHVRDYYDWQSNYAGTLISLTSSFLHDLHMLGLAKSIPSAECILLTKSSNTIKRDIMQI